MAVNYLAEFQRARRDPGLVVVPGFHALKHAVRFGAEIVRAVATDPTGVGRLVEELAPDLKDELTRLLEPVPEEIFAKLSRNPPSTGVLALARRSSVDVAAVLQDQAPAPVVLLESPRGLGNIGAVVRVAAAAGAAGVLCRGQPDPWDPAAVRGAAGLQFALPVAKIHQFPPTGPPVAPLGRASARRIADTRADQAGDLPTDLDDGPSAGHAPAARGGRRVDPLGGRPVVAVDPEGDPLPEVTLPGRAVLAFGAERRGLSHEVLDRADLRVRIPMRTGVSSLNLATAVSAVLFGATFGPE